MKSPQSIHILHSEPSRSLGNQKLGTLLEIEVMVAHGFESSLFARLDTPILVDAQMPGLDAHLIEIPNKAGHDISDNTGIMSRNTSTVGLDDEPKFMSDQGFEYFPRERQL